MKVLVLCSGAKDHAIAWWFSKSKLIDGLFVAPCNPGTEDFAVNLSDIDLSDKDSVLSACKKNKIDFVFIGTEEPLFTGVIDYLNQNGISTFGAPSYALKLEGDRQFAKEFAERNGVSIPQYRVFNKESELSDFLETHKNKTFVLKPNALAPSRVMVLSSDVKTLMSFARNQFEKKDNVVLEEYVSGLNITISLLLDEKGSLLLPICSEYTKSEGGDNGVITGGLGAVCPVPVTDKQLKEIHEKIIQPTLSGLKNEKLFYKGILTFSVIVNANEAFLVDYHVRLNDPATQTFVPLIKNDLVEIMLAMKNNTLDQIELETSDKCSVSVVVASEGYPIDTKTGIQIKPVCSCYLNNMVNTKPYLFFGAAQKNEKNELLTTGGRVATWVALADNVIDANASVYSVINDVKFNGAWYREDIGNKFFASST